MSDTHFFHKHLGTITLLLLVLLAGLKFYLGGCRLWLCMAFVGIVVAYTILSDLCRSNESGKIPNND